MRPKPFVPDTTSQIELRHHHALNYIAAELGEIAQQPGKIAAQFEATSGTEGGIEKALRAVGGSLVAVEPIVTVEPIVKGKEIKHRRRRRRSN
jgi:hypothetical protein